MGALSTFAVAHGSNLRILAEQLGVPIALLDQVDAGAQALPAELVPQIAAIFKTSQGDVLAAAKRTVASIDRVDRHARIPNLVLSIGPTRLHKVAQPTPLVVQPPPPTRYLWIVASGGRMIAVNERTLAVTFGPPAGHSMRYVGVASLFDTPSTERVYATTTGAGGEGPPPSPDIFDIEPVTLAPTIWTDPAYASQGFIRAVSSKLWKGRFQMAAASLQRLDLAGAIETTVDLSVVPAAPVALRFPAQLTVERASIHAVCIDDITEEPHFVEVDTTGAGATVRMSTGISMVTSASVLGDGQVALCDGALWVGDAYNTFPAPMPVTGGALFRTDLTTYVTTSVALDVLLGFWVGTMTTDGTKLYAGFRDASFNYSVARIATDGTVEAIWTDPAPIVALGAAYFDDGFLWVVAGFPFGFFSTEFDLVKIDPATMLELDRAFLFTSFAFLLGSPAPDIAATSHGPP